MKYLGTGCIFKLRIRTELMKKISILIIGLIALSVLVVSGSVLAKKKDKVYRKNITIELGDKKKIVYKKASVKKDFGKIKWHSENKKIAVVNKRGVIKTLRAGKTRIIGISSGKKYIIILKVKDSYEPFFVVYTPEPEPVAETGTIASTPEPTAVPGRIVIHRGKKSTAPENTTESFTEAVMSGYKIVESDVRFTADNVPVIIHDETIDRTSDGTGSINTINYNDLNNLNFGKHNGRAGLRIMTLETLLALCRMHDCSVYLEIKDNTIDSQKVDIINYLLNKYDMYSRVTFISFLKNNLEQIIKVLPYSRCGLIVYNLVPETIDDMNELRKISMGELFVDCSCESLTLNENMVREYNAAGYNIEGWKYGSPYDIPAEHFRYLTGFTVNL